LAEEAVISELVSARLFPVTRESTGNSPFSVLRQPRRLGFRMKIQSLANVIP